MLETIFISILSFIILIRSCWINHKLYKVIKKDGLEGYNKYPSHFKILIKFWIWDIEKFKK